jgi:hypothetical protein
MKRFIAVLALAVLFASPALAVEDPVGFRQGPATEAPLFVFPAAQITATDTCLLVSQSGDAAACDVVIAASQTGLYLPANALITTMRITYTGQGDATATCTFDIEVDGTAVGTQIVGAVQPAVGTVESATQNVLVETGEVLGVHVEDGAAACGGTADPDVQITLFGFWVN